MRKALKQQQSAKSVRSVASRTFSASIQDLRTHSEDTISSQASVYTEQSQRLGTQNRTRQDFDEYEDIIGEQIDTLFITAEQEKKIQDILQFARKGKINLTNAFELPVRVIDPQVTENTNMRFWKFASELLYASMNIYDKRVENVFQNTNKMFDNLIRMQEKPNKPLSQEQIEEKNRRQRGTLIQMDVSDLAQTNHVSTYEIAKVNCEDQNKINIKNVSGQFIPDPLFNKRLKAFDSSTLKSLFLNVFECGDDLQVTFFKSDNRGEIQVKMQVEGMSVIKQQEIKQEELPEIKTRMPLFIHQQLQKLNFIAQNADTFRGMQDFKQDNLRGEVVEGNMGIEIDENEVKLFKQKHFSDQNNSESNTYSLDQANGPQNTFQFNFDSKDITQFEQSSQDIRQTKSNMLPLPNDILTQFVIDEDLTVLTPWELQFKGSKLKRKKISHANIKTSTKEKKIKQTMQNDDIDFSSSLVVRKAILDTKNTRQVNKSDKYYDDKFINPKSMESFLKVHKKRLKNYKKQHYVGSNYLAAPINKISQEQAFLELDRSNDQNIPPTKTVDDDHQGNYGGQNNDHQNVQVQDQTTHTYQKSNYSSSYVSGLRNIRQIKQKIYQKLSEGRYIKLSEVDLHLSPSSILVLFLHLVNQRDLEVQSLESQTDIRISYRNQ